MAWRVFLLVSFVLLSAGCIGAPGEALEETAQDPGEHQDQAPDEQEPSQTVTHTLHQNATLSLTQVETTTLSWVNGENCLKALEDGHDGLEILDGTIEVAWEPSTPAAEELRTRVFTSGTPLTEAVSASPLTVDLEPASLSSDDDVTIVVDLPNDAPGVALEQEAALSATIQYEAQQTFSFEDGWACSYG